MPGKLIQQPPQLSLELECFLGRSQVAVRSAPSTALRDLRCLKSVACSNPVVLIDEIDKLGEFPRSDFAALMPSEAQVQGDCDDCCHDNFVGDVNRVQ